MAKSEVVKNVSGLTYTVPNTGVDVLTVPGALQVYCMLVKLGMASTENGPAAS